MESPIEFAVVLLSCLFIPRVVKVLSTQKVIESGIKNIRGAREPTSFISLHTSTRWLAAHFRMPFKIFCHIARIGSSQKGISCVGFSGSGQHFTAQW